eukprot:10079692-Karenia_brevis.AAC.1
MGTKRQCNEEGMDFIPMIVEASGGGWGKEACRVWTEIAKTNALVSGDPKSSVAMQALQRFSRILHRENARSIVRRLCISAQ